MTVDSKSQRLEAGHLVGLLERQLSLYRQLSQLSQRQRELVTRDDPKDLLSLLGARQKVVDQLCQLNKQLAPAQAYWQNHQMHMQTELRRRAETILQEVGEILKGILDSDEQDARLLSARKSQSVRNLRMLDTRQQAGRAYEGQRKMGHYLGTDQSA